MTEPYDRHLLLLQYALRANAAFSTLSALCFIGFASSLAGLVAIGASGFVGLGINLAVFAILLVLASTQWMLSRRWGMGVAAGIVLLDVGWVVLSLLLAYLPSYTTGGGRLLIYGIAAVVGLFALAQGYTLGHMVWSRYMGRTPQQDASPGAPHSSGSRINIHAVLWGLGFTLVLAGCSAADLRTDEVKAQSDVEAQAEKGRALLQWVAEQHGLEAWQSYETLHATATDYWADGAPGWWPLQNQRLDLAYVLGTFTSRAVLLDGPHAGKVWGIHAWQPYCRNHAEHEARFEGGAGRDDGEDVLPARAPLLQRASVPAAAR